VEFPHRGNFLQQPDIIATNVFDGFTFTNGVRFPQTFRRVGGPDIVIAAGDPAISVNSVPVASFRNVNWSPTPPGRFCRRRH
jgi:hypothetical protein